MARTCLIACLLVGYVAVGSMAAGIHFNFGSCLDVPILDTVNFTEFFNGTWHVDASAFNGFLTECADINFQINSDNITATFSSNGLIDTSLKFYVKNYVQEGINIFSYLTSGVVHKVLVAIIGTDNENWAIGYACEQFLNLKLELPLLLLRNKSNNSRFLSDIENAANLGGLSKWLTASLADDLNVNC